MRLLRKSVNPAVEAIRQTRSALLREGFLLLVYMATAALVLNLFMQTRSLEEGSTQFGFAKMLDGTAERPYVYRRLVPLVANFAASQIPEVDHAAFVQYHLDRFHLRQRYFGHARYPNVNQEQWTPAYALKFHVAYAMMFASLLGTMLCLRGLSRYALREDFVLVTLGPILFVLLLPLSFLHGGFYYDFPELFFLSALLLSAFRGAFFWWVILLPLAVLNKESSVLVPLLFLPLVGRSARTRGAALWIGISITGSLAVYMLVQHLFRDNTGVSVVSQLAQNLDFWLRIKSYFLWHDFYAPLIPFPRGLNLLNLVLFLGLIFYGWRSSPPVLRQLFLVCAAVNIPLFLAFCYLDEMRNLSFLFIPAYLVGLRGLARAFEKPPLARVGAPTGP